MPLNKTPIMVDEDGRVLSWPEPRTDPPSDDELSAWEQLAEAATPGPWALSTRGEKPHELADKYPELIDRTSIWGPPRSGEPRWGPKRKLGNNEYDGPIATTDDEEYVTSLRAEQDTAFIVAAREAVPRLIAEVRRLRAREQAAQEGR